VFGGKAGTHVINRDGAGRVCFERIVGWAYLLIQPAFNSSIARQKRT
jgi:hypothetical protein